MRALENCTDCLRLAEFLAEVGERHPDYHARPVSPFGDPQGRLLIVGLAPGMHGANRTGRPFTGDFAGILLYETLHRFGFASRPESVSRNDGLELIDCRITNAVKCLPPGNKPEPGEIRTCNAYLAEELNSVPRLRVILALGGVAHKAVLMALGMKQAALPFAHGLRHELPPPSFASASAAPNAGTKKGSTKRILIDSYHCSRYNTQTKRLTSTSFHEVFRAIRNELDAG